MRCERRQRQRLTGAAGWVEVQLEADPESLPIDAFRPEYRDHVAADRVHLASIRTSLQGLSASSDPKLVMLKGLLDASPSQKIAVFAGYGETFRYLNALPEVVGGRSRVTVIGSESDPDSRLQALSRFCPETVVRPGYVPPDGEVDLLLSTDVLSEGQNLQQAAQVISYDMPWNPQRVVQRYGRVIRLKSPHERVTLTTMLPSPGELETLLGLEATVRRKILSASVFRNGRRGHRRNRASGAPSICRSTDRGRCRTPRGRWRRSWWGICRRRTACRVDACHEGACAIAGSALGVGAAFRQGPSVPSRGGGGIFFACRAQGRRYWRYVDTTDIVLSEEAEMLRRINPGDAPPSDPQGTDLEASWKAAVATILDEHNRLADPRAEAERLGPAQRWALDLLRDPTVSLPDGATRADESSSVERSPTVRQALSRVRDDVQRASISRDEAARRIVAVVDDYGLQVVPPAPPLEPIMEDDVGVVCWMAVLAPGAATSL